MPQTDTKLFNNNQLFIAFLVILVWLPLPLGSNRPALESVMHIGMALASGWWILLYASGRTRVTQAFLASWPTLTPLAILAIWQWIQSATLPFGMAEALHGLLGQTDTRPAGLTTLSLSPHDSARSAMNTFAYLQVFSLTLLLIDRKERIRTLIMVLVLSGTFQAAYGAFMVLSGSEYLLLSAKEFYRGVATGTFVNRNHLAGYLELCIALGIGLLLADMRNARSRDLRDRLRRLLNLLLSSKVQLRLLLAVMVIGLVMTRSRMGNSAFFVSLTVMAVVYFIGTRKITRSGLILFGSLLLVDSLIVGSFFGFEEVVNRIQSTDVLAEERPQVARDTLQMISDYPVTGIGAGAYYAAYPGYQSLSVGGYYDHAHNDYLEFTAELGVPGVLLAGFGVIASIGAALRAIVTRRNPLMRGLGAGAFMGLLALMIHAAVDFNFYIPANAATFVVTLALPWIALRLNRQS